MSSELTRREPLDTNGGLRCPIVRALAGALAATSLVACSSAEVTTGSEEVKVIVKATAGFYSIDRVIGEGKRIRTKVLGDLACVNAGAAQDAAKANLAQPKPFGTLDKVFDKGTKESDLGEKLTGWLPEHVYVWHAKCATERNSTIQ